MKIAFILYSLIATLLFPNFISDNSLSFSNSAFSILFGVLIYLILDHAHKHTYKTREIVFSCILGFLFSFFTSAGYSLKNFDILKPLLILQVLIYTPLFSCIVSEIWHVFDSFQEKPYHNPGKLYIWFFNHPYIIFLMLIICWTPALIADFPGGFRYDATDELKQIEKGFNGAFPMLHSVIITRLLPLSFKLTKGYELGVAFYVIIQMALASGMYTHIFTTFAKKNVNSYLLTLLFAYCAIFPIIQLLVVQEVRDVIFSILITYSTFLFYLMSSDKEKFFSSKKQTVLTSIVFVLTILARNNNAGITLSLVIITLSLLLFFKYRKINKQGALLFSGTMAASYILLSILLIILCKPLTLPAQNGSLSLMSQSLVRSYQYDPESWTDSEIIEAEKYIDIKNVKYIPNDADSTKSMLKVGRKNLPNFAIYWFKTGLKHPRLYIEAMLANNQAVWFPNTIVDGYNKAGVYVDSEKCYFYIKNINASPVKHYNLFPLYLDLFSKIGLSISFEKIPIVSMLFSIGFQFWILLTCCFYNFSKKHVKLYLPLFIMIGYAFISSFVPLILLRYFAAIFFMVPMTITFCFESNKLSQSTGRPLFKQGEEKSDLC